MKVRSAVNNDIDAVVKIHRERFEKFFLSSLGEHFLKTYYRAFLNRPGILLILEDEGQIGGFAAGSEWNYLFYKKLIIRNLFNFAIAGINILFTKPKSLLRIFSNLKSSSTTHGYGELLSIATLTNKKGYGALLLKNFELAIKNKNGDKKDVFVSLTTDFDDNDKVVNFYKMNDYQEIMVFNGFENRKMYRFIKKI